ncbi:MAG: PrsW family intramembrane metalloprotease, partial [Thermomicrobiales bacterium]
SLFTLLIVSVAAIVPAIAYVAVILSLDRYEHEPLRAVAYAFSWGAVGAVIFSVIAEAFFAGFATVAAGEEAAGALTLIVAAPVIEEAFKGIVLLLLLRYYRHELDSVLDGLVYGAIIGIGFAMTENIGYFLQAYQDDGASGLGELFFFRVVVNGFGHAMYTGVIGAAIGWSRSRYRKGNARYVVPVLGYCCGVILHMLWNGGVVGIAALQGDDASLWTVMLVEAPLFVLPPLVILYLVARRGGQHELTVMQDQLREEVARGIFTHEEYEEITSAARRRSAMRHARKHRGWRGWQQQRAFYEAAGDLAFRKYHLQTDTQDAAADLATINLIRRSIPQLRAAMPASPGSELTTR